MPSSTNPRILVVDDSELVLEIVKLTLESEGYEVITKSSPFEAFMFITREQPDLVLLDMSMPGMEGDVLLGVLQGSGQACRSTILLHSDRDEASLSEAVKSTGAHGFIRKTGDPEALLAQVSAWLR
jgi:CheY-like chemotaxis protein